MTWLLGIDGGGTRCRARLTDAGGQILGEGLGGPANIRLGLATAWSGIMQAVDAALAAAGLDRSILDRTRIGLGLAGIVTDADGVSISKVAPLRFAAVAAVSDAHTACLGATGGADGAILITGTGSQGFALVGGTSHAIGGYGFPASDQGSGAWIGREAVRAALLAHDGLAPLGPLTRAVLDGLGGGPAEVVPWSFAAKPADYAALAPLVLEHAGKGDEAAATILRRAADDLAAMARRLRELGAPTVSLVGGLSTPLLPWLPDDIRRALAPPKGDAMDGALILARRAAPLAEAQMPYAPDIAPLPLMAQEAAESPAVAARQMERCGPLFRDLGARLRALNPSVVVTCARGSSDHAASYGKYLIETALGLPVASVGPSVVSLYDTPLKLDGALFIAVSQSGKSPDLLRLTESAKAGGALTVAFVNDEASPLAGLCDVFIPLCAGPERSVAATKSYVASLLAFLQLTAHWSDSADLHAAVAAAPGALSKAAALDWHPALSRLVSATGLYVIGRGLGMGVAQEMALKCKETCRLHAEAFSAAEVIHGPLALVGPGFPVLALSQHDQTREPTAQAAARMAGLGADVLSTDPGVPGATALPVVAGLPPELEPMAAVLSFYLAIHRISAARGLDPDVPANLRKVTETI